MKFYYELIEENNNSFVLVYINQRLMVPHPTINFLIESFICFISGHCIFGHLVPYEGPVLITLSFR